MLRIVFRVFVVIVGFLILSGAINTSIIGSTGVLMRVAEDGVLTDWFRKPHRRFGTSYRIINLITGLQLFTIIVSRGNVITLGEAYAFGVIWSFTFNSPGHAGAALEIQGRARLEGSRSICASAKHELPVGLFCVFLTLLIDGDRESVTKSVATESGIAFAAVFFIIFSCLRAQNATKHQLTPAADEGALPA